VQDEDELRKFSLAARLWYYVAGPLANVASVAALFALVSLVTKGPTVMGLFVEPWVQTFGIFSSFVQALPRIFSEPGNLSGVVGIVAAGDQFVGAGVARTLFFAIILNVNLAVLNLLPIPPLDGAKIVFAMIERVIPAARRAEAPLMIAGWGFLLLLMAVVTCMDIGKLMVAGSAG
jgi:RIP metalloprotease RseP